MGKVWQWWHPPTNEYSRLWPAGGRAGTVKQRDGDKSTVPRPVCLYILYFISEILIYCEEGSRLCPQCWHCISPQISKQSIKRQTCIVWCRPSNLRPQLSPPRQVGVNSTATDKNLQRLKHSLNHYPLICNEYEINKYINKGQRLDKCFLLYRSPLPHCSGDSIVYSSFANVTLAFKKGTD